MFYRERPPVIEAHAITWVADTRVGELPDGDTTGHSRGVVVEFEGGERRVATAWMIDKRYPEVGDYWVGHESGHCYVMRKGEFESKYVAAPGAEFRRPVIAALASVPSVGTGVK